MLGPLHKGGDSMTAHTSSDAARAVELDLKQASPKA
jgi:hypothetical protein